MSIAYILSGSNLGQREKLLKLALKSLERDAGKLVAVSSVFESPAWGFDHPKQFLNQAIELSTKLSAHELLNSILLIEKELGRKRKSKLYEARTIDIDILFYDDQIIDDVDLVVPHPRLHERRFALLPMLELAPDHVHPVFDKSIHELYNVCTDESVVKPYHEKEDCHAL